MTKKCRFAYEKTDFVNARQVFCSLKIHEKAMQMILLTSISPSANAQLLCDDLTK